MADYDLKVKRCAFPGDLRHKCCVHEIDGNSLNVGPLYTISGDTKEERTYDEPYSGDLPRRSWLCCPGTQQHIEADQPPLLEQPKTPSTPGDPVIKAPSYTICTSGCVRINYELFLI